MNTHLSYTSMDRLTTRIPLLWSEVGGTEMLTGHWIGSTCKLEQRNRDDVALIRPTCLQLWHCEWCTRGWCVDQDCGKPVSAGLGSIRISLVHMFIKSMSIIKKYKLYVMLLNSNLPIELNPSAQMSLAGRSTLSLLMTISASAQLCQPHCQRLAWATPLVLPQLLQQSQPWLPWLLHLPPSRQQQVGYKVH